MEQRQLKVSCCKAGGNASKNALSYKLTLPVAWIKEMGINFTIYHFNYNI